MQSAKVLTLFLILFSLCRVNAQKFEQLGSLIPPANDYRNASGAPGKDYWQQQVDYKIDVSIDDEKQILSGDEVITYYNNSPDKLAYLWLQLDQNARAAENLNDQTKITEIRSTTPTLTMIQDFGGFDYEGGLNIKYVKDNEGAELTKLINRTMMRIDLPEPLAPGQKFQFSIGWSYNIYDRLKAENGRGGYEYFPADGNYAYTCAQWYPRLCTYDEVEGWQNKQFIVEGEFSLEFGSFDVNITVPADHIVGATGVLVNSKEVLTNDQYERFNLAKKSFDKPIIIATQDEAIAREKNKLATTKIWHFSADSVRDFAFASSRKYIWDAQAVRLQTNTPLAMSFYPKEGNPLWERESTKVIKNTLEVYSSTLFDYPYPVAIAVNAADIGMEYPMICFNRGRPTKNGKYSTDLLAEMVDVVVHEIGHNYFPMIINSDERMWAWMDEGINTFVELQVKNERYPELNSKFGDPRSVVSYMRISQNYIRPLMTSAENVTFSAYTDYGVPSAALCVLRDLVMGPELFDIAFKEYANRWKFKRPKPADFFRTMEDASAVDLDWFWRGWFFETEPVDVSIEEVKWFRVKNDKRKTKNTEKEGDDIIKNFEAGPQYFSLTETDDWYYGQFNNRLDDKAIIERFANKNFYEIRLRNVGGLLTPIVLEFVFIDGSQETKIIPAEIWRLSDLEVMKVFYFDKEVQQIIVDPNARTADVNTGNNIFPKK